MATYLQFNDDDTEFVVVHKEGDPPVHPNQYLYTGDVALLQGALYDWETKKFYKDKRVIDFDQPLNGIQDMQKVSG